MRRPGLVFLLFLFSNNLSAQPDYRNKSTVRIRQQHQLAEAAIKSRDFERAFSFLTNAGESLEISPNDSLEADNYFLKGKYYYFIEKGSDALWAFEQAGEAYRQLFGAESRKVGIANLWIGNVYAHKFFQIPTGMEYYDLAQKSINLFSESERAELSYNLARVYQTRNELEASLVHLKKAENFYRNNGAYIPEMADCYNLRAIDFLYRNDTTNFFKYEALAIETVEKNRLGLEKLGKYFDNIGAVKKFTGECDDVPGYFRKAIVEHRKTSNNLGSLSNTYLNLGEYFADCEQSYDSALFYYKKCLEIRRGVYREKHSETAAAYLHLGSLFEQIESYDSALYYYQLALISEVEEFSSTDISDNPTTFGPGYGLLLGSIMNGKARVLKSKFKRSGNIIFLEESLNILLRADKLLTSYKNSFHWNESKLTYRASIKLLYSMALGIAFELYEIGRDPLVVERAFYFMENARYSLLLEDIRDIRNGRNRQEFELLKNLEAAKTKRDFYPEKTRSSFEYASKVDSLEQELQLYYNSLSKENQRFDQFVSLKVFEECNSFLKQEEGLLVSYYWDEDSLYVIDTDGLTFGFYAINTDLIAGKLREFKILLAKPPGGLHPNELGNFSKQSNDLFRMLLPERSKAAERIMIVPDGPLINMPFETLLSSLPHRGCMGYNCLPYLLNSASVEYWLSFSIVKQLGSHSVSATLGKMLAVAPHYEGNSLPGAAKEVASLSNFGAVILHGEEVSKESFLSKFDNYEILHIAGHANASMSGELNSYIEFSSDSVDRLWAYEILGKKINASLAVLTSCETGSGEYRTGEGIYSLGRAFASAGVRELIVSAWKIPDDVSFQLTKAFYQSLFADNSVADALRKSKMEYLARQDGLTGHPFFWSSLYLIGHSQPASHLSMGEGVALAFMAIVACVILIWFLLAAKRG